MKKRHMKLRPLMGFGKNWNKQLKKYKNIDDKTLQCLIWAIEAQKTGEWPKDINKKIIGI